jgi:hypothetical protein
MTNKCKTRIRHASSWVAIGLVLSAFCSNLSGQQSPQPNQRESMTYRTIGLVAGAGGGFTLGLFAGLAAFDDAINSDRKVWTAALLSAAGGAVGGYFLGRHFDKRRSQVTWIPDRLDRSLAKAQFQNHRLEYEGLKAPICIQARRQLVMAQESD